MNIYKITFSTGSRHAYGFIIVSGKDEKRARAKTSKEDKPYIKNIIKIGK